MEIAFLLFRLWTSRLPLSAQSSVSSSYLTLLSERMDQKECNANHVSCRQKVQKKTCNSRNSPMGIFLVLLIEYDEGIPRGCIEISHELNSVSCIASLTYRLPVLHYHYDSLEKSWACSMAHFDDMAICVRERRSFGSDITILPSCHWKRTLSWRLTRLWGPGIRGYTKGCRLSS